MKRIIMTAAVALLAGGAYAQSDCPLQCKDKDGAKITQVADEVKNCSAEQAAQCAEKAQACAEKAAQCGEKSGAAITQVAGAADGCSAEQIAACAAADKECATKCADAAKITLASNDDGQCAEKTACADGSYEAWRKTIPVMAYNVGDKTTTCTKSAAAMCAKTGDTMSYVVNNAKYDNQADAMKAHTKALNAHLDSMTRVSFVVAGKDVECPMTAGKMCEKTGEAMQFRVGPAVFDSAEEAVMAAAMARGMSKSVNVSYEVDGKATTCSKTAKKMCGSKGKMSYVVSGAKTDCNVHADNMLASERVNKALEALEMATSQS